MLAHSRKQATELLLDIGPLLALVDRADAAHAAVMAFVKRRPKVVLVTTWPCITEAMYLAHQAGGHRYQEGIWNLVFSNLLHIHDLTHDDSARIRALMSQYADTPMDLADASLVAIAESLGVRRVFTLDDDFYVYRLADGTMLEVVR